MGVDKVKVKNIIIFMLVIVMVVIGMIACSDNESSDGNVDIGCTQNNDCISGEYCSKALGDCDGQGNCNARPEVCTENWEPVCGCDGITYSNTCYAARAGVSVKHSGDCTFGPGESPDIVPSSPIHTPGPTKTALPCTINADCPSTDYCSKNAGDCDGKGDCIAIPQYCMAIWEPVCGCDGKTYSNACYAAGAGVSIKYDGECSQ